MPNHYIQAPPLARIERFVDRSGDHWLWTGATTKTGYGHFRMCGEMWPAHRAAYTLWTGPIPVGKYVLHRCHVRSCVRPDHLYLGTQQDNMRDMREAGRASRGNRHFRAALTESVVRDIRRNYAGTRGEIAAIARQMGVSPKAIRNVIRRVTWKHI